MHVSPPDRYSFLSELSDLARRLCPEKVASRKRLAAFLVSSGILIKKVANIYLHLMDKGIYLVHTQEKGGRWNT